MISPEIVNSLKDLIEGRSNLTWKTWWGENADLLENELGRTDFLKFKFDKLKGATDYLHKNGVTVIWGTRASLLNAYANYHDNVLDEDGRPKKSFLYKIMGGVVRLYDEGKKDEVREILNKHINKIIKTKDIIKRSEKLNDFEIDLEQLIDTGYIEIGKIGLLLFTSISSDDDLLVTAIENAGKKLALIS